jgi:hypothetical protein
MISKMLKATDDSSPPKSIGGLLGVPDTSLIHHRVFRNHLEHYDERLKRWIQQFGPNCNIGMNNIGPKSKISFPGLVFVRHFDPTTGCFTFVNDEFDLKALHAEVGNIETIAQKWLEQVRQKRITHNI